MTTSFMRAPYLQACCLDSSKVTAWSRNDHVSRPRDTAVQMLPSYNLAHADSMPARTIGIFASDYMTGTSPDTSQSSHTGINQLFAHLNRLQARRLRVAKDGYLLCGHGGHTACNSDSGALQTADASSRHNEVVPHLMNTHLHWD